MKKLFNAVKNSIKEFIDTYEPLIILSIMGIFALSALFVIWEDSAKKRLITQSYIGRQIVAGTDTLTVIRDGPNGVYITTGEHIPFENLRRFKLVEPVKLK